MAAIDSKSAELLLYSELGDDVEMSDSDECSSGEEDNNGSSKVSGQDCRGKEKTVFNSLQSSKDDKEENNYHKMYNIESRNYQNELLKLAIEQNIIICLPTGTGKTYIALKLTEFMLPEAIQKNKKIVFLANNVPLVHQQAKYFSANLVCTAAQDDNYVRAISGDLNVDIWKEEQWKEVLENHHIFVMSTQIFLDAITKAYVKWNQITLMILDECHHAQKNHPMAVLMKNYGEREKEMEASGRKNDLPKVLGLTATIIKGQSKVELINQDIEEIEKLLRCKAVTHRNYEEVLKHSTDSSMTPVGYTMTYSTNDPTCSTIVSFIEFLSKLPKTFVSEEEVSIIEKVQHPSLISEEQIYNKDKGVPKTLKSFLADLLKTYEELGPYCCKIATTIKLVYICQWIRQLDDMSIYHSTRGQQKLGTVVLLLYSAQTILVQFIQKLDEELNGVARAYSKGDKEAFLIQHCISNKLKRLLNIIESKRNKFRDNDELCGLVFCERRITAQVLRWYFKNASEHCPDLAYIKPELMIGNSTFINNTDVARFNAKRQTQILKRFHDKELNLLVATQVVEEGLNVPACNLVVRFDIIQAYTSFVQSMGRARKKGAECFALIEESIQEKENQKLHSYRDYNIQLAYELEKNAIHIGEGNNEDSPVPEVDDPIPPFCPTNDIDGPIITATESISIVHRYCNSLSCDKLAELLPFSFWENNTSNNGGKPFRAVVILPSLSPIRDPVKGNWMPDKTLAKRSGFLEVCKLLYEANELGKNLLPKPRNIDNYRCEFLDIFAREHDIEKSSAEGKIGSRKRVQQYPKQIPQQLMSSKIVDNCQVSVYRIEIIVQNYTRDISYKQLYNFEKYGLSYGIVTTAEFELPPFELLTNYGSFKVQLQHWKLRTGLREVEIDALEKFQRFLCESVYKIKNPVLVKDIDNSLLIAPLRTCPTRGNQIDWKLVSSLNEFDEKTFLVKPDDDRRNCMQFNSSDYENAIIVPWYKETVEPELLCTVKVSQENALSEFEEPKKFPTFKDYFNRKYNVTLCHPEFPLIECKEVAAQLNFLTAKTDGKSLRKDMQRSLLKIIPELTIVHELPASLYIQGRFLPSILHRISRFLLANQLRQAVACHFNWEVGTGLKTENESTALRGAVIDRPRATNFTLAKTIELDVNIQNKPKTIETFLEDVNPMEMRWDILAKPPTANISKLYRYQNHGRDSKFALPEPPVLKSNCLDDLVAFDSIKFPSFDKLTDFKTEKGPSIQTIMETFTLSNAQDCFNLEKLEVMGDSVLKVVVSLHIFRSFPHWDEGKMTLLRMKLISNSHLYQIGKKHQLGEILSGSIFIPSSNWLPPGLTVPPNIITFVGSQKNLTYEAFKYVDSVDLMNAEPEHYNNLISMSNGPAQKEISHTTLTHSKIADKSIADSVEAILGAYFVNGGLDSTFRIMEFLGLKGPLQDGTAVFYSRQTTLTPVDGLTYNKTSFTNVIPFLKDLEEILNYKFKNPLLAVEALTHPTYMGSHCTPCYERLEYVGDAILDFLVTNYIFTNTNITQPGDITDLRSALVNNVTFGSLAVRYGFHTFLKHDSELLRYHIMMFADHQAENNHVVNDPFKLFSDFDCPTVQEIEVPKVLGDIFESIAGAVFVDSMSIDTVWKVFYRLMKNELELFSKKIPKNPLRQLGEQFPGKVKFRKLTGDNSKQNEYCASKFQAVSLSVPGLDRCILGVGSTIKQAKQAAAKYVVRKLISKSVN